MTDKTDAQIIADTHDYIREVGWCRGTMQNTVTKKVCTLGGLSLSQGWLGTTLDGDHTITPGLSVHETVTRISNKIMAAAYPDGWEPYDNYEGAITSLTTWNDGLDEDMEQVVLDTLAKAEKIERAGYDPDKGITP